MSVTSSKVTNFASASVAIGDAAAGGARLVLLPEMWNCPYSNASFMPYSEYAPDVGTKFNDIDPVRSPSSALIASLARKHGIYLVAGSIPERVDSSSSLSSSSSSSPLKSGLTHHLYNTCVIYSPDGDVIGKHRKIHLFDIDVPGKMVFKESDTLSAGSTPTLFDCAPHGLIGVGICYDMRFNEYASLLTRMGARMIVYPGAFNTTTGPLHWELLARGRAVDEQCFVATCSPARDTSGVGYQAWGHSTIVSPWGRIVATCDHTPSIVIADCDMSEVDEMRRNIPIRTQKREDVYKVQQGNK